MGSTVLPAKRELANAVVCTVHFVAIGHWHTVCDKVIPLPRVFDAHTGVLFSSTEASAGFFLRSRIHVVRTQPIAIMRHVTNDT